MFKNAQPYMLQFHVKESHIHFWTFFDQKDGWLFSRIWRWFCKHGIKKRGEFLMVDRFYVCFYSDRFWLAKPLPLRFYLLFRGFLSHGLCWQMMQFITVLIALTPSRNNTDPKNLVPCLFNWKTIACGWVVYVVCCLVEARPHQLIRCPWKTVRSFLPLRGFYVC